MRAFFARRTTQALKAQCDLEDENRVSDSDGSSSMTAFIFRHGCGDIHLEQRAVFDRDVSGMWAWSAGELLAEWLCASEATEKLHLDEPTSTAAIELGCGTGLVALSLARLGVKAVVATDHDKETLAQCNRNAIANALPNVHVMALPWGGHEATTVRAVSLACNDVDGTAPTRLLIVGADILYDRSLHDALEESIRVIIHKFAICNGLQADIVLSWSARSAGEGSFLRRLQDLGEEELCWRGNRIKKDSHIAAIGFNEGLHQISMVRVKLGTFAVL